MSVTVRYFAGARAAAGIEQEPADASTLGELRAQLAQVHGERLERVLTACSFLVNGVAAREESVPLPAGAKPTAAFAARRSSTTSRSTGSPGPARPPRGSIGRTTRTISTRAASSICRWR